MKVNKNLLRWGLLAVIAISFAVNFSSVFDSKLDRNGDNLCYYFLGRNLAEGNGYVLGYEAEPAPHMHFPPGYPVFISLVLKIFPDNTDAIKVVNGLLFLLSLCLLFRIIRKTLPKYALPIAFLTAFLCTLHPVLLRWSTIMMSEMLYLAVSMGIIAVCVDLDLPALWRREKKQIFLLLLLCVLVFCTYFIRTMGIAVIAAAALSFMIIALKHFVPGRSSLQRWLCPLAVSVLVILSFSAAKTSWDMRNHRINPDYAGSYTGTFLSKAGNSGKMESLDDWKERICTNLGSFVTYYIPQSIFHPGEADSMFYSDIKTSALSWITGALCLALMIFGIFYLSSAGWILLIYLVLTFGVLLLYQEQFAGLRYMVPVIPLLLFAFLAGIASVIDVVSSRFFKSRGQTIGIVALVLVSLVFGTGFKKDQKAVKQMAAVKSEFRYPDNDPYKQYILASSFFAKAPENYLVACRKPEIFYYFSKYHHCVRIPLSATPEEVLDFLERNKVDAVILDCWFPHAYRVIYPAVLKYPEHFSVLARFGDEQSPSFVLSFIR